MTNQVIMTRYDSTGTKKKDEPMVREMRANLVINGELFLSMMCLPKDFEQMAVGFMFSEGLIESYNDISKIDTTCTGNIFVFTRKPIKISQAEKIAKESGDIDGDVDLSFLGEKDRTKLEGDQIFSYKEIIEMMSKFNKQSDIFNECGGVHSAALRFKDGKDIFYEDVGRHNAVDKVIGTALMENLPIKEGVLLISGRISTEIVLKTARLGIPVLVSQSGPTSVSLAIAQQTNMTLIGFARGLRFNVYAGAFRITS